MSGNDSINIVSFPVCFPSPRTIFLLIRAKAWPSPWPAFLLPELLFCANFLSFFFAAVGFKGFSGLNARDGFPVESHAIRASSGGPS